MPSKPLFGSPVAVGISDAVMAMRSVVSAFAACDDSSAAASAVTHDALRMSMMPLPSSVWKIRNPDHGKHQQISGQTASRSAVTECRPTHRFRLQLHVAKIFMGTATNRDR